MIELIPARHFRSTPGVRFDDIGVPGSNGLDLVEHDGPSVSPPNLEGAKQWYKHTYQDDYNRVIRGHRLFQLFNKAWEFPHWFVMLDENSGALKIPAGTYHRSYSGVDGSLLINHAVRSPGYDESTEFLPQIIYRHNLYTPQYHGCREDQAKNFIDFGILSP